MMPGIVLAKLKSWDEAATSEPDPTDGLIPAQGRPTDGCRPTHRRRERVLATERAPVPAGIESDLARRGQVILVPHFTFP